MTQKNESIMDGLHYKEAVFAGGCFWCMQGIFEAQSGVIRTIVGYAGGDQKTANYQEVSTGKTKHKEAVKVIYDSEQINYKALLELYWTQIDPTNPDGQFADIGHQYQTAIFYQDETEKSIAEASKIELENSKKFPKKIVTQILPFTTFFEAEAYHQEYYKKQPWHYNQYKKGSGRADFIHTHWEGIPEVLNNLKAILSPLSFRVTQEQATEAPFENAYWDHHEDGIYVDILDGTPLFSSRDKFDSGTGWPSFSKPIEESFIGEKDDESLGRNRTEVVSRSSSCHLGHVFNDGPDNLGGMRYCINSAALKFIPLGEMKALGYEKYLSLFQKK